MTEITKIAEGKIKPRYSVNPTAFFFALICAPLVVTLFTFWTVIGLFALPFGIIPYLVLGTPVLLWAVGWLKPTFGAYAMLGLLGNTAMGIAGVLVLVPTYGTHEAYEIVGFVAGFGLIFAPLYAGAFGSLYATFHPNIRILQT